MMITKRSKITANNKPKQSIPPTDPPLVRLPEVSTKAALASAQPLTSAEFLHELEQQRTERGTRAEVEELTEAIMAAATPRGATGGPGSPPGSPPPHGTMKVGSDGQRGPNGGERQTDGGASHTPQRRST